MACSSAASSSTTTSRLDFIGCALLGSFACIERRGWQIYSERFWRHLEGLDAFTLGTLEAAYRAELEGRTDQLDAPGISSERHKSGMLSEEPVVV